MFRKKNKGASRLPCLLSVGSRPYCTGIVPSQYVGVMASLSHHCSA